MKTPECRETCELLPAFEADELDPMMSLGIQKHLDTCAACRAQARWDREVSASLRRISNFAPAPAELLRVRLHERPRGQERRGLLASVADWLSLRVVWMTAGAAGLALMIVVGVVYDTSLPRHRGPLWDFVSVHVHGVAKAPTPQIATSDPTKAENWLQARLPFPVRAPRTIPADFHLIGAKICQAGREPAGVLLFERAGERVSCFIQPPSILPLPSETRYDASFQHVVAATGGRQIVCGTCRGIGFAAWKERDLCYVLVADVPEKSLLAFADS